MSWGDEAEVAAARERQRRSNRMTVKLVAAVLFVVFAVCLLIPTLLHHENAARAKQLAVVAASVSAQQGRWNAEHPVVDASENVDAPDVRDVPDDTNFDEEGRATIAKLAKNPRAIAAKEVTPPDEDHPWTSYDYDAPGLGSVTQNRWSATKWEFFLAGRSRPEIFAATSALKPLDEFGALVQWWRITDGTFRGDFVQRHGGGISLFSSAQICGHAPVRNSPTPLVDHECGY